MGWYDVIGGFFIWIVGGRRGGEKYSPYIIAVLMSGMDYIFSLAEKGGKPLLLLIKNNESK